jgi:hypothetical protein
LAQRLASPNFLQIEIGLKLHHCVAELDFQDSNGVKLGFDPNTLLEIVVCF